MRERLAVMNPLVETYASHDSAPLMVRVALQSRGYPAVVLIVMLSMLLAFPALALADDEPTVTFSHESCASVEGFDLELSAPDGWTIYYTVDGSIPDETSPVYEGPIPIVDINANPNRLASAENVALMYYPPTYDYVPAASDVAKANVIRAVAIAPDGTRTPVVTHTYFIGDTYTNRYGDIMVAQIVVDPNDLLDYDTGILVLGAIYDEWAPTEEAQEIIAGERWDHLQANFTQKGRDWERPASIEIFDGSDVANVSSDCGVRLHGTYSRIYGQRGFNVYFRDAYGPEVLDYALFPDNLTTDSEVVDQYETFMFRNGGNECQYTKYQDVLIIDLSKGLDLTAQAHRPCVLFVNGEYWGLINLQEKYSGKSFEDRYGVAADDVVLIKDREVDIGEDEDIALYETLLSYANRDLSNEDVWREFCSQVDLESMVDYYAFECCICNIDCRNDKNQLLWRSRTADGSVPLADGRWRWVLYDSEYSMGQYYQRVTSASYPFVPHIIEVDPLFASAWENPNFRHMFLDRVMYLCGTDVNPERDRIAALMVAPPLALTPHARLSAESVVYAIDGYARAYRPYMEETCARFGENSMELYESETMRMKQFAYARPGCITASTWALVNEMDREQGLL